MQSTSSTNNIIYKDTNKQICEALGCSEEATKEISVDVGKFGTITLLLCGNCVGKFVYSKKEGGAGNAN
jgi:hypothetical protein